MRTLLTRLLGDKGERLAARFLRQQGLRIIARNFKNHIGEIDLIALDGDQVVFVEVKTRKSTKFGQPVEAVGYAKQKKITQVALSYLKKHKLMERSTRFDIVGIIWPDGSKTPEVKHYRHAFDAIG
jgi:putative endonuclease